MNHIPQLNRRAFVVGTAAAGAGLALGFDVPLGGPTAVRAADGAPEVNAWVVIRPDDTVVIIADKASTAGVVAKVMDEVRSAGITDVSIAANPNGGG